MSSPMEAMLDAVEWTPVATEHHVEAGQLPVVTHEGTLQLLGSKLKVFQLSNGQRVIDGEELGRIFRGLGD